MAVSVRLRNTSSRDALTVSIPMMGIFFSAHIAKICFLISSPFLLSMRGAKVYDLDSYPVEAKRWTELENVKIYYDFFKEYEREF